MIVAAECELGENHLKLLCTAPRCEINVDVNDTLMLRDLLME